MGYKELNMGFLDNLTNDDFANKMADYYHAQKFPTNSKRNRHPASGLEPKKMADYFHTHIDAAEFKSIRAEIENVQTPMWLPQPFIQRGIQRGQDNPSGKINFITAPVLHTARIAKFLASPNGLLFVAKQGALLTGFTKLDDEATFREKLNGLKNIKLGIAQKYFPSPKSYLGNPGPFSYIKKTPDGIFKSIWHSFTPKAFSPIPDGVHTNKDDGPVNFKTLNYGQIQEATKETSLATPMKSFRTNTRYGANDGSYAKYGLIDYDNADRTKADDNYGETEGGTSDYVTFKLAKNASDKAPIYFRSYGLGSITDNTAFSWSEVKYSGRTMAQQKFDSVSRDVSHDLMIVSFTPGELKQNYNRLNKLYQLASPSINNIGLPTAPFCQLTLGDLYKDQNVIIDKITFTVDEATSWDIGVGTVGVETAKTDVQLPMVIRLSLGYKLITNAGGKFFTNSSNYWKGFTTEPT